MSDANPAQPDPDAHIGRLVRRALTTFDAATALEPREERSQLLTLIVQSAARMVGAGAASLFLIDETGTELTFEVAIGPKADEVSRFRVPLGHGIAGTVAASGQAIAISAPERDPRFASEIAQSIGHVPQSILCVPMRHGDEVIGVLEALDKTDRDTFTPSDIEVLSWFAEIATLAVEHTQRHDGLRSALNEILGGAVAPEPDADAAEPLDPIDAVLRSTRVSPEYRASLEIAALISAIGTNGVAERQLCVEVLRAFQGYLQARNQPYAFTGLGDAPWSR